jgi:hypothetical protein
MPRLTRHCGWTLLLAIAGTAGSSADEQFSASVPRYDFLLPVEQQEQEVRNGSFTTTSGMDLSDPFAVVSSGSLWQNKESVTYSRAVIDHLSLNCTTSSVSEDGTPAQVGSEVRAESVYQPFDALKITGNVHDNQNDASPAPVTTNGAGCSVETHLPLDTVFTAAVNSDEARTENNPGLEATTTTTNAYDAQLQKPLGKLPVSLLLKGNLTETSAPGAGATRLPTFEQSLVWKPADATTLQAGLRQQQYQNFPGIDNELNEALFADWSQKILDDKLTWHSYAEMMNTRSTVQIAEPGLGANGTAQPNVPQGGSTLGSNLPVSTTDEKVTFSTGPSVQLQKDISASLQYSSSWDQNPMPGNPTDEQRVSVSLKGTF